MNVKKISQQIRLSDLEADFKTRQFLETLSLIIKLCSSLCLGIRNSQIFRNAGGKANFSSVVVCVCVCVRTYWYVRIFMATNVQ